MTTDQTTQLQLDHLDAMRRDLDALFFLTKSLKPIKGKYLEGGIEIHFEQSSEELDRAGVSLSLAKAWLGHLKGFKGEPSPYKNDGKRTSLGDIEPVDPASRGSLMTKFSGTNHIKNVDFLREEAQKVADSLLHFVTNSREESICRTNAWNHIVEAKINLGFELGRIRDEDRS